MNPRDKVLGIDIGSVSVSLALLNSNGTVEQTAYRFHYGDLRKTLLELLKEFNLPEISSIACSSSTPGILKNASVYDSQICLINGVLSMHKKIGSILNVGGEKFGLIQFDKDGEYRKSRGNSSCAAGTGSFLDQQARRLNLEGIEELSAIAYNNSGDIPKIASRCAVFAKTDLIHAQQEGFTLEEICDGLCFGLARNIVDTLFTGEAVAAPVIFAGGVSRNMAVVRHLETLMAAKLTVDEHSHLYGAIGAAISLINDSAEKPRLRLSGPADIITAEEGKKEYFYAPLDLLHSHYPDFSSEEKYLYTPEITDFSIPVEVDIYAMPDRGRSMEVYLGVDIGSTSTKAALMDNGRRMIAGFYTRTAGRPLQALQAIFEALDDIVRKKEVHVTFRGMGTTGSGRKFIGRIAGADMVVDEITAHARAACRLNPDVDTIIEIGGQDSKFTTLRNGMVTFSIMNTVCAAGTGSFIEEQASKLGCPLAEYSGRTEGERSPIASDRCTVFMERDINHYLNKGYEVDEILATVLHSIRDNYMSKVAIEASIGDHICFQGATARNKALVAAFEQKLGKPIFVSKYCHLTGALGVALLLSESNPDTTAFRGLDLYRKRIPISSEVCDLCNNHCKIKIASVEGETVAYGFLCGRDYSTRKFVDNNLSGFDLMKERKKAFAFKGKSAKGDVTVGIPAALHIFEELPLWKKFFDILGIPAVTSEGFNEAVKTGKMIAGAEFCAPMAAMHGHIQYLNDKADFIFVPVYLEARNKPKGLKRQYCYYTQYAPALVSSHGGMNAGHKCLLPLINHGNSTFNTAVELYKALKKSVKPDISFFDVFSAFEDALEFFNNGIAALKEIYSRQVDAAGDVSVVILGRPYTVCSRSMNKGIPDIFASLGVKTFWQDMVPYSREETGGIEELLSAFHWNYASRILEVTEVISQRDGVYPVLVTSFKCSPDSFVIEYFKRICDKHGKPYLILQLDEHDSSVGYETRIEAGVRSFRNHHHGGRDVSARRRLPVNPRIEKKIDGKTLLIPSWDPIACRLIQANFIREGIDARLLQEDATTIQKSLRHNTGQCIPLNAIAQEFMDYIGKHNLKPENSILWMAGSEIACNIKLYPYYIKSILDAHGRGMEKASVYVGDTTFIDINPMAAVNMYFAYMFGGFIKKMGCKVRPYEVNRGATDKAVAQSVELFYASFLGRRNREEAVKDVVALFEEIEVRPETKSKVAIFGDLYSRDNEVINQDLIHCIENAGGEVITTPYSSYVKMVAEPYFKRWLVEKKYFDVVTSKTLLALVSFLDKKYYRYFEKILKEPYPEYDVQAEQVLGRFNVKLQNAGESLENLIKVFALLDHYPDISLFVQASPAFCCPSLITEAMTRDIEKITGIPVVSITYDGTESMKNDVIIPYIKYPRRSGKGKTRSGDVSASSF